MSAGSPELFSSPNLSLAWKGAFEYVMSVSDAMLRPTIVTIGGFDGPTPPEVSAIRSAVEADLQARCRSLTCDRIAFTIFPHEFWKPGRPESELFEFYRKAYPKLIARAKKANSQWGRGTYFHRLIAPHDDYNQNQLAHVIARWNSRCHHGMVTQLSCREVPTDQNNSPRPGFPCLQQIGLSYSRVGDGAYELWLNAFYPLQDMVTRAYGNYLGLCRLGSFLAHYMNGCRFAGLNCFVAKPSLGNVNKGDLFDLQKTVAAAAALASTPHAGVAT
jgi:hypothetical protein